MLIKIGHFIIIRQIKNKNIINTNRTFYYHSTNFQKITDLNEKKSKRT